MKTERKIRTQRFTLIEAIIVVVIIAVFTVLFLVAKNKRRHPTYTKARCMNNLKQMGLAMRMYSTVFDEDFPHLDGRTGLYMLATEGFLENTNVYRCPSTEDVINTLDKIPTNASYAYAGGLNEASSLDSAIAGDRALNHDQYGAILFIDGHVKGYSGSNWTSSAGGSQLKDFK